MTRGLRRLYEGLTAALDVLRPQSIESAKGFIRHDYLIPAGYYQQMWDWDGFFIGYHLASRSGEETKYLRWWVLNFVEAIDGDGYVSGCLNPTGPEPKFGKFAMKPFLSQGAYFASYLAGDFGWVGSVYEQLAQVIRYRESTQLDEQSGLFFWDNAMQSGADNNVALTNDENDREAILAADASAWQYREYLAMARIAHKLRRNEDALVYERKADDLRAQMLHHLWYSEEKSFFNIRRNTGEVLRRVSYSNFIPLVAGIPPLEQGRSMIKQYLWNRDHMLAEYGLRTLSRQDSAYNNASLITPYSNWQGPVWPIANYLYFVALKNYGFENEAVELAATMGELVLRDINACGSMHENYHADTGEPLAPMAEQSPGGVFTGFVGWNMLVLNMLEGVVDGSRALLEL